MALNAPGVRGDEDPGAILRLPRGNTNSLKNTGTELFQIGTKNMYHKVLFTGSIILYKGFV
jgi:hypothetical protein